MDNWKNNWIKDKALGSYLGMAKGAASIFNSAYDIATPNTESMLSNVDKQINNMTTRKSNSDSLDSLIEDWNNSQYLNTDLDVDDYYIGPSGTDIFRNTLESTMSGITTGATAGPWGALIGGAIGLGSGLIGGFTGKSKAEKAAQEAVDKQRKANEDINSYNQSSLNLNASNLKTQQRNMLESQYFAIGGNLNSNGTEWTNGLTMIGNGGTHGENPLGGVPIGIAQDGQPNLVEEGEVIWNDYVFSNRLKVPNKIKEKYKLKGDTFAEVVKKAQEASAERPNDSIEKRGLDSLLGVLMGEQEMIRQRKEFNKQRKHINALGGHLFQTGGEENKIPEWFPKDDHMLQYLYDNNTIITTPEYLTWKGVLPDKYIPESQRHLKTLMGIDQLKKAQTKASEETIIGNKTSSDNINDKKSKVIDTTRKAYADYKNGKIPTWKFLQLAEPYLDWRKTYIDFGTNPQRIQPLDVLTPNTTVPEPIDIRSSLNTMMGVLEDTDENTYKNKNNIESYLRYAPILGNAIGLGYTLANPVSHKYADELDKAALEYTNGLPKVSPTMLGDYLSYNPFDRMFYANELGAQQAANRRAIMNVSNNNRGAAIANLLASDYNNNIGLGKLYREGEEYNLAQRQKVADFNRGTNMTNMEADLKSQMANAEMDKAKTNLLLDAKIKSLGMKQAGDAQWDANLATNLSGLFSNLGDIGWEAINRNMVNSNLGQDYMINNDGTVTYKGKVYAPKKNGGYLTIRRKRNA
jgi:hypothetical protein